MNPTGGRKSTGSPGLQFVFLLNVGFTLVELAGGIFTNSLAIISSAIHDLGDSFSLGLAWYLDKYAEKGRDRRYSYGYRRFSLLAVLANTLVITTGSLFVLAEAVPRLLQPQYPKVAGMALLAFAGIIVNGLAVLRVKGGRTLNVRVVTWHLLGDLLGWTSVLAVSIVMAFKECDRREAHRAGAGARDTESRPVRKGGTGSYQGSDLSGAVHRPEGQVRRG